MQNQLSKAEKFFIDKNMHLTVKQLAKELNIKASLVKYYLEEKEKEKEKVPDLFQRDKHNSTVMTAAQSSLGDELVQNGSVISEKHKNSIYVPNPDKSSK